MAAQIANTYAKMLDKMNKDLTITATKRVRHYVEGRLAEKAKALADAENAVKKFQDENRVRLAVEGSEGVQNDLSMIGGMASQILGLEVELAGLKEYAQPNHPMVIQMEAQIRELRRQVDRIERETVRGGSGQDRKRLVPLSRKFVPSFEETTSLNFEMQTLARRLKVEEMIHGSLVSMLESAKLAEARDLPTVQVLDSALPPEGPSKPNMLYNLMAAGGLSLVFAIFLTVFLDYLDRLRVEERERALAQVATEMVSPSVEGSNGNGLGTVVYPSATGEAERLRG
jgi:uncharacterized protein involved in exopolysaccharide biosynthesis